jgi:hypothetical protein
MASMPPPPPPRLLWIRSRRVPPRRQVPSESRLDLWPRRGDGGEEEGGIEDGDDDEDDDDASAKPTFALMATTRRRTPAVMPLPVDAAIVVDSVFFIYPLQTIPLNFKMRATPPKGRSFLLGI